MPRSARLDLPGLLQHVIVRGIERRDVFLDGDDRAAFVRRLAALLGTTQTDLLAWALLSNHFHLLVRPEGASLSAVMRRLMTGHAVRFNRRHGRKGHLFQNRYKSIVWSRMSPISWGWSGISASTLFGPAMSARCRSSTAFPTAGTR